MSLTQFRWTPLVLSLGLALPLAGPVSADDKIATRTELQVVMQRHVDRGQIEGAILDVDFDTGALRELYLTDAHPMIMQGPGYYVLCADLATKEGELHEVDYYVAETDRGYRVFRTEIDNRAVLAALVETGEVTEF